MKNFEIFEANYSRSQKKFSFLCNVPDLSKLLGKPTFTVDKMYHFTLEGKNRNPILFCFLSHDDPRYKYDVSSNSVRDEKLYISDTFDDDSLIGNLTILGIPVVMIHEEDVDFRMNADKQKIKDYVKKNFRTWTPLNKGYNERKFKELLDTINKDGHKFIDGGLEGIDEPKIVVHGGVLKPNP